MANDPVEVRKETAPAKDKEYLRQNIGVAEHSYVALFLSGKTNDAQRPLVGVAEHKCLTVFHFNDTELRLHKKRS